MASTLNILILAALISCGFSSPQPEKRNMVTEKNQLWPYGVVPIVFDDSVDGFTMEKVLSSLAEVQISTFSGNRACISFVPRTTQVDYATFTIVGGAIGDSEPGRMGGNQPIHLYPNMNKADIMQLLVYTLGFYNEFRRPDRDNFVTVNYDNIDADYRKYFDITNGTTYYNYPFDFESITFFYPYAFAADPSKPSMQAKYESQTFPWKVSLSAYDVYNIQRMYDCGIDNSNRINLLRGLISGCSFEFDFCDWTQDETDDFNFERNMGPTSTPMTGPNADISSGIGYYALARAKGNHNKDARLRSPTLPAGDYCFRFYYYLSGVGIHKARIIKSVNGGDTVLNELEGDQGQIWHRFSETISSTEDFQIVLESLIGGSDAGDMAFDDAYILKGKCLV